ncbi:MAG: DUF4139 domain-containing protein [Planctomycetes bacterium]|nr:DUF4139 domain-containing protein [Planctomycetota bacterium]
MGKLAGLAAAVCTWAACGWAGEEGEAKLDAKLARAVVFKDGFCMLVKKATGKVDGAGRAFIEGLPENAILGSFWVVPTKGKLLSMVSRQQIIAKQGKQETEKRLVLEFDPKVAEGAVEVELNFLGPGIRWIPTYRIALGEKEADMAMQAEVLNEAEDLAGVPVDLVVGVPSFRFRNLASPLTFMGGIADPLRRAAPQIMDQSMSNVLFTQRAGEVRGERVAPPPPPGEGPAVPALPAELAGEQAQDLFVYHVPKLSLRAGERAAVPVISAKVPCRSIHTWDVQLARSGAESLPDSGKHASPIRILRNEVWHQVELANKTAVPWTTGAALVVDGYLPIGQELLTYTSVGGRCQVPMTVAVDVRGTYEETETERIVKAVTIQNVDFAKVTKKGTLRVTNYKKKAITLYLACQMGGNAIDASDDGKMSITDYQAGDWGNVASHPALSGHSTVRWELAIEPGATKEVTCRYSFHVRH